MNHLRIVSVLIFGFFVAFQVQAGLENVTYPIAELGNCESQEACFTYCDEPDHWDACMAFAEEKQLLEEDDIQEYKQTAQTLQSVGGPGGCTTQASCDAYCSDLNNASECISYAEAHGLMDDEELEDAKKVIAALEAGYSMPGECTNHETCEAYCEDEAHQQECMDFAVKAGFMTEEEVAMMQEMGEFIGPGGCDSEESCEAYCSDPANGEECMQFFEGMEGIEGMEPPESHEDDFGAFKDFGDAEGFDDFDREMMPESFTGPGGCQDPAACMEYCMDPAHVDECIEFGGAVVDDEWEHDVYDEKYDEYETYKEDHFYDYEGDHEDYDGYGDEGSFDDFDPGDYEVELYPEDEYEEFYDIDPSESLEFTEPMNEQEPFDDFGEEHSRANQSVSFVDSVKSFWQVTTQKAKALLTL